MTYFDKALPIVQKYDDKGNLIRILHYLAAINKDKGIYNLAIKQENEALEIAQEIDDQFQVKWVLEELSYMYADLNDFGKAYK